MSKLRFRVVESAFKKKATAVEVPAERPSEYFAKYVFNREKMFKYLPSAVFAKLVDSMDNGAPLDRSIADQVATGMKKWATELGVTHYTHWFQPLTEGTAEKHDAFVEHDGKGGMIEEFAGKLLVQQEPDASSFPNGGIRNTFEARGYSAWDPSSPVFIVDDTLCIPTVFIAYTGESLDYKAPLLKSLSAVNKAALDVCHYFNPEVKKIITYLGWEQEYFLVDEGLYAARPDLLLTGRTLMGHEASKNQQLEDHYFGAIPSRVAEFMKDIEIQSLELGIPLKTRHNEVAPNQFEFAPIYEECNLAVDHNMLLMSLMKRVARVHGFRVLLHEKPFKGVNGSGKHNNWSISYGNKNLLDPGSDPQQNAIFLTVLTAIIEAVDKHSDLLRNSVASAGNDHRLGANEAPPAIISIFLGAQLNEVIENMINGSSGCGKRNDTLKIGVDTLPVLPRDATDRNRTSPFAFTGNKFEFRAPGSAQSCAGPMMTLNTIVAESLDSLAEELSSFAPETFLPQLQETLKRRISEHKRIIFNGDNYSEEWVKEAERRGLPNLKNTMTALHTLVNEKNVALFEKYGVFSRRELESRFEIFLEEYHRRIRIEGRLSWEMAATIILPALRNEYGQTVAALSRALEAKRTNGTAALQKLADKLGDALDSIVSDLDTLETALTSCHEDILAAMSRLRTSVDAAETLVNDRSWPLPKYREMLFIY